MKPVTEPGIYDIPIDVYHSQKCCDGPSVSSSGLRKLLHECPARFWATSDLNPKAVEPPDSKALSFGRAAHALVLGEPEFARYFVISPFDDFKTSEARVWRDAQKRQILKAEQFETVKDMAKAQRASPETMRAFTDGLPEQSLICKDDETGLWLKARPDWLPHYPALRLTTEYKTAETIKPERLSRAVFGYGYDIQAALGLDVIEMVTGKKPLGMAHICQEKDPPYLCELRMFTPEQIDHGRRQYRKGLRLLAHCLKTNTWPGYTTEPSYFDTPYHIVKEMESFDDDGYEGTPANEYSGADYLAAG